MNAVTQNSLSVKHFVEKLNLEKHVEGGYFKRVYASQTLISVPSQQQRPICTSIYYLLAGEDFSAFHRLKSDEIWSFNYGSSLTIYIIDEQGNLKTVVLGDPKNPIFQITISANLWFAAEVNDKSSFTLVTCIVAPGFDYADFELADKDLELLYPQHSNLIRKLTR